MKKFFINTRKTESQETGSYLSTSFIHLGDDLTPPEANILLPILEENPSYVSQSEFEIEELNIPSVSSICDNAMKNIAAKPFFYSRVLIPEEKEEKVNSFNKPDYEEATNNDIFEPRSLEIYGPTPNGKTFNFITTQHMLYPTAEIFIKVADSYKPVTAVVHLESPYSYIDWQYIYMNYAQMNQSIFEGQNGTK